MEQTTQIEATLDAKERAKKYGIDWHVIRIHNELTGYFYTAVSTHYFMQHPHAHSLYCAKAESPDLQGRQAPNGKILSSIKKFFTPQKRTN